MTSSGRAAAGISEQLRLINTLLLLHCGIGLSTTSGITNIQIAEADWSIEIRSLIGTVSGSPVVVSSSVSSDFPTANQGCLPLVNGAAVAGNVRALSLSLSRFLSLVVLLTNELVDIVCGGVPRHLLVPSQD